LTAEVAEVGDDRPHRLAGLVDEYLQEQYAALADEAIGLRRGENRVHRFRVAIRRIRSTIRIFGDLFESEARASLDAELRWFAEILGRARDLDVVRERLEASVHDLPPDLVREPIATDLASTLSGDRAEAGAAVEAAMRSPRYLSLLRQIEMWQGSPPRSSRDPKASAVAGYVGKARRQTDRRLRAAIKSGDESAFHRARKAAKRHRYAAELAAPWLGAEAAEIAGAAAGLQDELGALQDTLAARAVLLDLGRRAGDEAHGNGFAYGLMYAREQQAGDDIRRRIVDRHG
jgi:CHAD domain-containing protein